jgi:hypothetical protein
MTDLQQWSYQQVKGRIASHVARGTDNLQAVIKSTFTMSAKCGMGREALEKMLDEVNAESVLPFLQSPPQSPWRQPERLERFVRLKSLLLP